MNSLLSRKFARQPISFRKFYARLGPRWSSAKYLTAKPEDTWQMYHARMCAVTRRSVVKQVGFAGAGFLLEPVTIRGQGAPITIAGRAAEIAVAPISASTVRITVQAVIGSVAQSVVNHGALVPAAEARATMR